MKLKRKKPDALAGSLSVEYVKHVAESQSIFNVIVEVTISCRSFVFGQSRAKVSAGFTNVNGLAVAAFDLVYCSLSVLRFVFVLDIN